MPRPHREQPPIGQKAFTAPPDRVFAAALKAVGEAHYELRNQDEQTKVIAFTTGRTAFSCGYNMILKISPAENNTSQVSIEVVRLHGPQGKVSLVASGKKDVQKVFKGIEKELSNSPAAGAVIKAVTFRKAISKRLAIQVDDAA